MQYLNTFISLLAKTQSRDKILRLVQYATIHSEDHQAKGATFKCYTHVRNTRKWLRFLAWIQLLVQLKKIYRQYKNSTTASQCLLKLLNLFEGVFKIFFYLFDHRVVLGEAEILSKDKVANFRSTSLKMYLLQNVFGALKSLLEMIVMVQKGSEEENGQKEIRNKSIEFLRNILDIFVACYYLNKPTGTANRIGIVGILTSLIGIAQSLNLI